MHLNNSVVLGGQNINSSFSITSYIKPKWPFLANPIHHKNHCSEVKVTLLKSRPWYLVAEWPWASWCLCPNFVICKIWMILVHNSCGSSKNWNEFVYARLAEGEPINISYNDNDDLHGQVT